MAASDFLRACMVYEAPPSGAQEKFADRTIFSLTYTPTYVLPAFQHTAPDMAKASLSVSRGNLACGRHPALVLGPTGAGMLAQESEPYVGSA